MFKLLSSETEPTKGAVLLLQIPRTNEKKELAAEQMLASLHGLLADKKLRSHVSFEIAVQNKRIGFYVWVPEHLKSFVEEQVYAQYPDVHISEVTDYTLAEHDNSMAWLGAELRLTGHEALPIKTFPSFEVDPLASITATLAQFEETEEAWLQIVISPAPDNWYKKSERYTANIRGNGGASPLAVLWSTPQTKTETPKLAEYESARANAAEEKSHKLAYQVSVRVVYRGHTSMPQARMRLQAITATFKQFNTTYLNGFTQDYISKPEILHRYRNRSFGRHRFVLNIEEIASLYHLPHTNVETPNILWASSKTAEPPANLPIYADGTQEKISPIAITNFRGHNTMFGMPRIDRGRHLYIIGQTGVGKSALLELLTISDIYSPYGFAVIDPHGDYALNILKRIPAERAKDVIYFNPADTEFPIAFNPMEVPDAKLKTHTASELIGVLKRMFESWGPRLEYILRYCLLALLDYPDSTMLDITRMLTDKKFRLDVISYIEDPVVKNFWTVEFASWNDKFAAEAVAPVLNKVGAFTANPIVRNIIGQPKSSFNIRQIMDDRKILIVNLSRGLIGEDNAALLGALLVTKVQMGAMSRADIAAEDRIPFYLYVDEFQNFATDSFATILSEARKYALNLTVANQYIAQMSLEVKDAVFGNVGSVIAFRMGADDARVMQRYFEPKFEEHDLVHMHNRNFVVSMTIEGEKAQAFSATTLNLPTDFSGQTDAIVANSRENYAVSKSHIEGLVKDRYLDPNDKPRVSVEKTAMPKEASIIANAIGKVDRPPKNEAAKPLVQPAVAPDNHSNDDQPKKKRRRRRRNKHNDATAQTQPADNNGETVINLR